MPTALETRSALVLLTSTAVGTANEVLARLDGPPEVVRAGLLETIPAVVDYYSDGAAALAADFYEESRELARVTSSFSAEAVVVDRTVKLRTAIAWAAAPLLVEDFATASQRLGEVVQPEVALPFRDTILTNRRQDPDAVGWRRITRGGCKFCRMLADRGAVYKKDTALFAAHPNCNCTAEPVFKTNSGPEASVMQYMASQRRRSAAQKSQLRGYLEAFYPDAPG